ncbi:MAG: HypC/HybG/HupF family hydrogenase formation chaperone [Desulfovibrionales bacterium]
MCLAIPVKILHIEDQSAVCRVGESDTTLSASLMLLDEKVDVGDYLIVHAGFALRKMDLKEANETLAILRDMVELMDARENKKTQFF